MHEYKRPLEHVMAIPCILGLAVRRSFYLWAYFLAEASSA